MGAAHILSKARNAAVTFCKPTSGRIFPEVHGVIQQPSVVWSSDPRCVVECAGEIWIKFLFCVCFIEEGTA